MMDGFFVEWMLIAVVTLAAAASPGPDFVITVRNALVHGRAAGYYTALGISLAVSVHMTYCILGIAAVIASSETLFAAVKWLGAGYLIYIGIKALCFRGPEKAPVTENGKTHKALSPAKALGSGFLCNLLNPKATLFFFALFTQVIDPHTPLNIQILYGATVFFVGGLWWAFIVTVITNRRIKDRFISFSKWIDRITGGLLIALGVRLALSKGLT